MISKPLRMAVLLLLISANCASCAPAAKTSTSKPSFKVSTAPTSKDTSGILGKSTKSKATILLAQNGKALQPIVISAKASDATKTVATELAEYLKRITGATFEVKTGDGKSGIVLGTLADFPNPGLAPGLQIRNDHDGREAFAIWTEPQRLRLIGATEKGVSHAAFRFLELLGYRHFFPAPEWEVVPTIAVLRFDRNEVDRPALLARRIWYGYGYFGEEGKLYHQFRPVVEHQAWSRHNRMASSLDVAAGHAWQTIIHENKALFDAHPEYLALTGGKRQGEQLCVSNPAVQRLAVEYALNYLKKNPTADMVSMEASDGYGQCECENCAKLGTISDRVFGLVNIVAKAVAKEYPGKMVGSLAYGEHSEPPAFDLEPNVYVQLTVGFIRGRYTFDELAEMWPKKCRNMGFYDYFSVYFWDFDMLPGGRGGSIPYIRKQIPRFVSLNATSMDAESGNNWGPHGRGYYIANKLMWNPKADVDALLFDFYAKAFGPAAAPMKRYYERLDPGNHPLMSEHLLALSFRDVDEASRLAKDRPDVQARLDHIKQYLRYVHLRWMTERETDQEKKKALTLETLTHTYRTRYSYMNHWEALRQSATSKAAEDFKEPTWNALVASPSKPWAVETSYTREETERVFREGLEYFQPKQIEEKTFSQNLVPVKFEGSQPAESWQAYQGVPRYALYSLKGEPLVMEITTGIIEHYRNFPPARYKVVDTGGKAIAGEVFQLDGKVHPVEVKVPRPGLYFLEMDDSFAAWNIKVASERPVTIMLERDRSYTHLGHMRPTYFYVPKGTKQVHYFWSGGKHKVHGPDGKVVQEVTTSGDFVKIDVPQGMDGKPWHFTEFAFGKLLFFNIPNYLAGSPNALLLPREVVEKDQLTQQR